MSYLDDLSPPPPSSQPPDDDGDNDDDGVYVPPPPDPPAWYNARAAAAASDDGPPSPPAAAAARSGGPAAGEGVRTGGVPSGRGPEKSYLEILAGGGGDGSEDGGDGGSDHATPDISDFDAMAAPPPEAKPTSWSNTGSYLSSGGQETGEPGLFLMTEGGDDARTDVRNLLTQRAIQSFVFLLEECRDPHSGKWIQEDFLDAGNLLHFHGTGAGFLERFGGTWDAPLLAMLEQPRTVMVIHAKRRGRGHGGWSKNNPFLPERFVQIPVKIDPVALTSRILEVREQLADEWSVDLDAVRAANREVLRSYLDGARRGGNDRDGNDDDDERRGGGGEDADEASPASVAGEGAFERAEFSAPGASSPFRRGNFDLLYNLCTQAAVHRLLREDSTADAGRNRNERDGAAHRRLREFYTERAAAYFDGDQPYGRADDFLDAVLRQSPGGLADPVGTVERILRKRDEVTEEWRESMRHVREEHNVSVRRVVLSKLVESWEATGGGAAGDAAPVPTARGEGGDELGAFE